MKKFQALFIVVFSGWMSLVSADQKGADFVLKSVADGNVRLSEHYGEVILLNFWATWCGPCRKELPVLEELQKKYERAGFSVLAVSVDDQDVNVSAYVEPFNLSYPVLLDSQHEVVKQYDIQAMPGSVFLSRDGDIKYVHLGYKDGDEEKYSKIIESLLKE